MASKREISGSTPSRCAMPHSSSPLARSISAASASAAGNPKRGRPAVIQQVIPQIVHVDPRHAVSFSHATFQTLRREYASYGRTRCRALAMADVHSQPPASGPAFPIPAISLSTYLLEYISIIVLHHASKEAP